MDLTFSDEQRTIDELARTILADTASPEILRAAERDSGELWPRAAWDALAEAGLLGISVGESFGGGGMGLCELGVLMQSIARSAAPLPAYASLVLGALPIEHFGSTDQRSRWLPGVVDGSLLLTGVLAGADDIPGPPCREVPNAESGRRLSGTGWYVPFGAQADAFVVPFATLDGSVSFAVIDSSATGLGREDLAPMCGAPSAIVRFDATPIDEESILDTGGVDGLSWLRARATAMSCIAQCGTCEGALSLTASYVSTREQFGAKLATFQAVAHRAADAWIDTELVRLTSWTALCRLAEGLDATAELATAKFFAAEAAQRVVAAAQHLHGGIGMDLDYPVHRYFRWAKEHELRLGGGTEHLASLGALLADGSI